MEFVDGLEAVQGLQQNVEGLGEREVAHLGESSGDALGLYAEIFAALANVLGALLLHVVDLHQIAELSPAELISLEIVEQ